jgi:hypothetical protein
MNHFITVWATVLPLLDIQLVGFTFHTSVN